MTRELNPGGTDHPHEGIETSKSIAQASGFTSRSGAETLLITKLILSLPMSRIIAATDSITVSPYLRSVPGHLIVGCKHRQRVRSSILDIYIIHGVLTRRFAVALYSHPVLWN